MFCCLGGERVGLVVRLDLLEERAMVSMLLAKKMEKANRARAMTVMNMEVGAMRPMMG